MPTCWIIAGPNGAGKTTFALEYLPKIAPGSRFINADLIAAGLSPLAPERDLLAASRLFLHEIETSIQKQISFAFETTLAGRSYLKLLKCLKSAGWRVAGGTVLSRTAERGNVQIARRGASGARRSQYPHRRHRTPFFAQPCESVAVIQPGGGLL